LKKRISEAFYIGMLDILPLLRDPMLMIMLSLISFLPVIFMGIMGDIQKTIQALVGAIVLSLFFGGIQVSGSVYFNKHWFRFQDIYVASPISPISYSMGLSISTLIGALPATILAMVILFALTPVSITGLLMVFFVTIVLWLSTVFLGFMIGLSSKNTRRVNTYPQVIGFVLGFLPPVYYPLSYLPGWLQPVAMLSPTTHAAQLAKYYMGLLPDLPFWQIAFGWAYLFIFMGIMVMLARRYASWVDP